MLTLDNKRLEQQLNFIIEIDKLKTVFRRNNLIVDRDRLENTAEHSWHLAFYVMILAEHANVKIDLLRVMKMVLLHDIVEIDAGDTFTYDAAAHHDKAEREQQAANRLFGILPPDQGSELMNLWKEFEARETTDAKFAAAVDHLQPLIHNCLTEGGSWKRHQIKYSQVQKRAGTIVHGSETLSQFINQLIDGAVKEGLLSAG